MPNTNIPIIINNKLELLKYFDSLQLGQKILTYKVGVMCGVKVTDKSDNIYHNFVGRYLYDN